MTDGFFLNPPAAEVNSKNLKTAALTLRSLGEELKTAYNKYAGPGGATQGNSADTTAAFAQEIDSAITATLETVDAATKATDLAISQTVVADKSFTV